MIAAWGWEAMGRLAGFVRPGLLARMQTVFAAMGRKRPLWSVEDTG
ncbi:MAG TPA: hypothetical protein VMZ31_04105 [Phycisphaerae bacterium]|nr:hypothetical protein [Phycisphaerae bacterium]